MLNKDFTRFMQTSLSLTTPNLTRACASETEVLLVGCKIACSRLSDSEEDGKFYFRVCAFSIQRTRQSKSLEQARCEHELVILSRCETKTFNPMRTFVSHIITVSIDLRFFPSIFSWGLSSYAFFSKFQFALSPRVKDLSVLAQAFQTRSYIKTYILQECWVTHVKW